MTPTPPGRTDLFLAPPAGEADEDRATTPRLSEEAMLRLRNPFGTAKPGTVEAGLAGER